MKVKPIFFALLLAALGLNSCQHKEICCDVFADYSKGIFVANEGPYGGTGTISWYNPNTGETRDSLFEKANNGAVLGQYVQSLTFFNGKGYIVVNGANRVVVVDAQSFKFLHSIEGLAQPRFFLPINNNSAYISQWGDDGYTGSIAKVDLNTHLVLKTIPTGRGPEKMIRVGDKVYVANSGGYGKDSTLTEISISDDSPLILNLPSGVNPATLAYDGQRLYYLCKGYYDDPDQSGQLDFFQGGPGVQTPASSDDLQLNPASGELYFFGANTVYKAFSGGQTPVLEPLIPQGSSGMENIYGMTLDAAQNLLYCADTKNYTTAGKVYVFKTDGTKIDSFRTGLLPGEIVIVK